MNLLTIALLLSLPQAPPKSPLSGEEQQRTFTLPPGFEIELVAGDPDTLKIVDIAFDDAGRMWAVTASEYPIDGNENPAAAALYKNGGKDQVLVFDTPTRAGRQKPRVFAGGLAMPMAVLPYKDGALVGHGPDVLFVTEANREVVLSGFGIQDSHLMPHRFVRGPGGWVYLAQGAFNSSKVLAKDGTVTPFDQCKVGRFKPDGSVFETVGWGLNNIWGFVIDRRGDSWIQEANDLGYPVVPFQVGASYPGIGNHKARPYAPWTPPLATFRMGGTGLSGLALSENFPDPWNDVMFVANPITRRVQAIRIHPDGPRWRLEKLEDFLTSTDEWFRPIAIHAGPDSCLYIVDWYNKIISHNEVPRNHPERDKTRSRVWRVRPKSREQAAPPDLTKLPDGDLPGRLAGSTWEARAAWHQIVDRRAAALAPRLREIAATGPVHARLLALWSLEGLGETIDEVLLRDPDRSVRREAVRILGRPIDDPDPQVRAASIRAAKDVATLLRFVQPPIDGPTVKTEQGGFVVRTGDAADREFERYLVRLGLETRSKELAEYLAAADLPEETRAFAYLALDEKSGAAALAKALAAKPRVPSPEEAALLARQAEPVLARLLELPGTLEALYAVRQRIDPSKLDLAGAVRKAGPDDLLRYASGFRIKALEPEVAALARGKPLAALRALREMRAAPLDLFRELAGSADDAVRREAVLALASTDGGEAVVIELWPTLSPALRKSAVDQLSSSKARAEALLRAVKDGKIPEDALDASAREKLGLGGTVVLRLNGGEEDYVEAKIDLDGSFTVEAWVRLDPGITNSDGILCTFGDADFNFYDSRFRVFAGPGRGDKIVAQRPIAPSTWTHVAVTRNAKGELRIYLDGEPDPAKGVHAAPFKGLQVGRTNAGGGTAGEIAEYRVWKVERTAEQVREFYNQPVASPDLVFHAPIGKPWSGLHGKAANRAVAEGPPLLTEAEARALRERLDRFRKLYDAPGEAVAGKAAFAKTCQNCHTLRGEGASIGPNLDGVGVREPEHLLRAIVTPSAAIEGGYRLYRVRTKDGDVLDGLLVRESPEEIVLKPVNAEEERIARRRVQVAGFTRFSVMPEGLLENLPAKDVSDLFSYLRSAGRPNDPVPATAENIGSFFNGRDLEGWDGNTSLWKVENGEIVGRSLKGEKKNEFLRSRLVAGDFRLRLQVRMVMQNKGFENSGIQFRSKALPDGEMQGCQADIGPGWWGKLYEESGRGLLWDKSGEAHVKPNEWNDYEVVAEGSRVRTFINGQACVNLDDPKGARSGIIALQLHSGGPVEIRFRRLTLELIRN
jgi:putative membrane-bound dehydrogenase-like protein